MMVRVMILTVIVRHERAKLISITRPEKHMKHCVLEKSSLTRNPLRFAKRCVAGSVYHLRGPPHGLNEATKHFKRTVTLG
jgi:hypothetical protein